MKLVRARPKRVEDWPDHMKCCDQFIAAGLSEGEMILDLHQQRTMDSQCAFCHAPHGTVTGAMDTADDCYTELSLLDIDEGPMEPISTA